MNDNLGHKLLRKIGQATDNPIKLKGSKPITEDLSTITVGNEPTCLSISRQTNGNKGVRITGDLLVTGSVRANEGMDIHLDDIKCDDITCDDITCDDITLDQIIGGATDGNIEISTNENIILNIG